MAYKYSVKENWGKNANGDSFIVDDAQDTWDNDNVDGETSDEKLIRLGPKPTDITLP